MQKLSRSLFAAAVVMGTLVACDDVETTAVLSRVTAVNVVPQNIQVSVGGKATLTATVVGDAGLTDRDVTWTSSDPTIATVDAAGVVTGVKAGQTTIIAASHADPLVKGAASVVVNAAAVPAVSISSITKNGLPIDINNVAGQVDVTLNLQPNGAPVNSVDLLVQCPNNTAPVLVQSQSFSGGSAPTGPITLSFNSAQLNAAGTAAQFQNGACNIVGRLTTPSGSPQAADAVRPATFNNADTAIVTVTTPATAADQANREWKGGGAVTVRVVPVIYSNPATVPSAVSVTIAGPKTDGTPFTATQPATAGTATFPASSTASNNVAGVTVEPATVTVSVIGANNVLIPITQPNVQFRLDNQAPQAGTYAFNTQGTANNWIGTAFVFPTGLESALSGTIGFTAGTTPQGLNDWGGVDRVSIASQAAPINTNNTGNAGLCSSANTGLTFAAVTTGASLQSSQVNGISPNGPSYCLRLVETDALGNAVTTYVATTFGTDRENPQVVSTAGVANQTSFNIDMIDHVPTDAFPVSSTINAANAATATYAFTLRDTLSGFDTTPINYTITRLFPGLSASASCVVGNFSTANGCQPADSTQTVTVSGTDRVSAVSVTGGSTAQGYFTFTGTARDQAANVSAALPTRTVLVDNAAPVVTRTGANVPGGGFAGNTTAVFNFDGTDNVDLYLAAAALTYPAATIRSSTQSIGTPFDATLTTSVTGQTVNFPNFFRTLTDVISTTVGAKPTAISIRLNDAATNEGLGAPRAIDAQDVANSTFAFGAAQVQLGTFTIISAQSGTTALDCVEGAACVVTVRAQGPTGTFENPFVGGGVNLYYVNAAGELVFLQQQTGGAQTDNGVNRFYTYTFSVTTPSGAAAEFNPWNLRAIGFTSAGDALLTPAVAVTTTPVAP